ncbi:hypothetical protein C9374_009394 [Naegleria lovaniensis]|uniref:Uncharacterized protein n=1 Tax=Naegleria lovaniensis TaxID=51637 RepID=A0AA88GJX5_NAELO|nr:uncharacterized protein C9374_009394 [Naegleria lovaniensis]KAG2377483.1 hypothetical protein C9374_009394 [Naegleria lovaniensis]
MLPNTTRVNSKHRFTTISILCTMIGSIIVLLFSIGYLTSLIILTAQQKFLLEVSDKSDGKMLLAVEFSASIIFLIMSVIGIFSVIDCCSNMSSPKYFNACSYIWTISIGISWIIIFVMIGVYGSKLDKTLNSTLPKDEKDYHVLYFASILGVTSGVFLLCCLPLCCCGIGRIIVTMKNSQSTKYRPVLESDEIFD